jgi:hypothetical protein
MDFIPLNFYDVTVAKVYFFKAAIENGTGMMPNNKLLPKDSTIPDEMQRAKYWADLLYNAIDKKDVYILAKNNLDITNHNSIKQPKAKRILEKAIRQYEEIYNH